MSWAPCCHSPHPSHVSAFFFFFFKRRAFLFSPFPLGYHLPATSPCQPPPPPSVIIHHLSPASPVICHPSRKILKDHVDKPLSLWPSVPYPPHLHTRFTSTQGAKPALATPVTLHGLSVLTAPSLSLTTSVHSWRGQNLHRLFLSFLPNQNPSCCAAINRLLTCCQ